jgi:hypothetical protein
VFDDESPTDTLARLKHVSDALDVAQQDSEITSREIAQTRQQNENANESLWSTELTRGVRPTKMD